MSRRRSWCLRDIRFGDKFAILDTIELGNLSRNVTRPIYMHIYSEFASISSFLTHLVLGLEWG